METINKFLKSKTPFAVIQYFEFLKSLKTEKNKAYQLVYVNSKKKLGYKPINEIEIDFVKRNPQIMKMVHDTEDGRVYEYNDFKIYKEANVIEEMPVLTYNKKEIDEYIKNIKDEKTKKYFTVEVYKHKYVKEKSVRFRECLKEFGLIYESTSNNKKDKYDTK